MPSNPYYNEERAIAYLKIARDFALLVGQLDDWQVGDVDGKISPIKHGIADALRPWLDQLHEEAGRIYQLAGNRNE